MESSITATTRLGKFIYQNKEPILNAWEEFARRQWIGPLPEIVTLRNHAEKMLMVLVADMATPQTPAEQKSKAEGGDKDRNSGMYHAAVGHALARVNDGFDIERLVAEFRGLRASVSRIWHESVPAPHPRQIRDMERFNEAIDQLVAVSVSAFAKRLEQSRRLFLGILGHDLRQPLNSMTMFTAMLGEGRLPEAGKKQMLEKMGECCTSMAKMITDLLDFTSTQLGSAMPVHPVPANLEAIGREVMDEVAAISRGHRFRLKSSGNLEGKWDPDRLRQVFSNLLTNAVQHGDPDSAIELTLAGGGDEVSLSVNSRGKTIPEAAMNTLFDPMVRLSQQDVNRRHGSIGLGLYICRQIATGHGGSLHVESSEEAGTTFKMKLPRNCGASDGAGVC